MPTEVIFPKVDMDMAAGRISRWFHRDGDAVRKGEPLFEMETDKAAMEVDAPASGTLGRVTGATGVDIAVGSPVAWIFAEGEAMDEAPGGAKDAPSPQAIGPDPDVERDSRSPGAHPIGAHPSDAHSIGAHPIDAKPAEGPAEGPSPAQSPATCQSRSEPDRQRHGVRATPLARRIARERGIDLSSVTGRGPHGRIGREDVEEAASDASAPTGSTADQARRADDLGRLPERRAETASARPAAPSSAAPRGSGPSSQAGPLHLVSLRDGVGTPIVLIHGFGSESASWRPLLAELAAPIGPVIGLDLAGHGGSLAAEANDFEGLVAGVEETFAAAGLTACHLAGHSLGGAVAAAVAAGTATDVRSLMLIAPAGFGPDIDTGFTEGFARATEEAPIRAWLRHLVADPAALSDGFVRATVRSRADGRHAAAQTRLAPGLFSNRTQHFEVRSLLPHLAMPVTIVAGTEDQVIPARQFAGLPGAIALHLFPRTGHLPQIEQRSDVARLMRQLVR